MFDQAFVPELAETKATPVRHGFENASIIIDELRQSGSTGTADALDAFIKEEMRLQAAIAGR